MYKPIILPLAKADIKKAAHWYKSKKGELGKRFTQAVRAEAKHICSHPKSVAIRNDNTRCAVLNVFLFMIHYTIDETKELVIISAVFHTSQSPQKWKRR